MRILLASAFYTPFIQGGAEISTQILAEGLAARGHRVDVVTAGKEDGTEQIGGVNVIRRVFPDAKISMGALGGAGVRITRSDKLREIYREFFCTPAYLRIYRQILAAGEYDIAHASGNLYCMGRASFWRACESRQVPVSQALRDPKLIHLDFAGGRADGILARITRRDFRRLHSVAAPSRYMLDHYREHGVSHPNSRVIPNAVDIGFVEDIGFDNKKNQVLYVGRMAEEKGIRTLLRAVAETGERFELLLVGDGPLLRELSLPEHVRSIGFRDRQAVYRLMRESKAVVLPSEWPEAFGRTIIESIANGTVALGSDSGAIPEILPESCIFETKNAGALAARLDAVLGYDKHTYEERVRELQKICEKYKKEQYIDQWETFFAEQAGA